MLLNFVLLLLLINCVAPESIECQAKFISKLTKLCIHGITEEKVISLLTKCCSTHCSNAYLKLSCTMKPHKFEKPEMHT